MSIPQKVIRRLCRALNEFQGARERRMLDGIYDRFVRDNPRADDAMNIRLDTAMTELLGERGLPGEPAFRESGWSRMMLLRYGLAMSLSVGKEVLECCSGLGWGAHMLAGTASKVTCIEIDQASIDFAKSMWSDANVEYLCGSVLSMPLPDAGQDVVSCMESVEHFDPEEVRVYFSEINRVLKPGGLLVGSSTFPIDAKDAAELCATNPFHKHVYTLDEMTELLAESGFVQSKVLANRLFFVARKRN